jgi:hypothetical protein
LSYWCGNSNYVPKQTEYASYVWALVAPVQSSLDADSYSQWSRGQAYQALDRVLNNGEVYECRVWPYSGWCGQREPGVSYAWDQAWVKIEVQTDLAFEPGRLSKQFVNLCEDFQINLRPSDQFLLAGIIDWYVKSLNNRDYGYAFDALDALELELMQLNRHDETQAAEAFNILLNISYNEEKAKLVNLIRRLLASQSTIDSGIYAHLDFQVATIIQSLEGHQNYAQYVLLKDDEEGDQAISKLVSAYVGSDQEFSAKYDTAIVVVDSEQLEDLYTTDFHTIDDRLKSIFDPFLLPQLSVFHQWLVFEVEPGIEVPGGDDFWVWIEEGLQALGLLTEPGSLSPLLEALALYDPLADLNSFDPMAADDHEGEVGQHSSGPRAKDIIVIRKVPRSDFVIYKDKRTGQKGVTNIFGARRSSSSGGESGERSNVTPADSGEEDDGDSLEDTYDPDEWFENNQKPDSDGDGMSDEDEEKRGTDPHDPDSDGDGVEDGDEAEGGMDPTNPDSDGDGLADGDEALYGCHPLTTDSDGDGVSDGDEVAQGSNPRDPESVPDEESQTGADTGGGEGSGDDSAPEPPDSSDPPQPDPEETYPSDMGGSGCLTFNSDGSDIENSLVAYACSVFYSNNWDKGSEIYPSDQSTGGAMIWMSSKWMRQRMEQIINCGDSQVSESSDETSAYDITNVCAEEVLPYQRNPVGYYCEPGADDEECGGLSE